MSRGTKAVFEAVLCMTTTAAVQSPAVGAAITAPAAAAATTAVRPAAAGRSEADRSSWGLRKGDEIMRGRYVVQHLGGGKRYEVFLARDERLASLVVAKILRPALVDDERARAGIAAQGDILGRLHHPVIARLFDRRLDEWLAIARSGFFDLMILDIGLPGRVLLQASGGGPQPPTDPQQCLGL
jgi:hypothetical protein